MALAYNAAGQWQLAIEAAKTASSKNSDPANLFCLAVAYAHTGEAKLAREAYDTAVERLAEVDDQLVSQAYQFQRREARRVLGIEA